MRTSRISQDTSKVLVSTTSPSSRRSTRSSLSRYAHNAAIKNEPSSNSPTLKDNINSALPDIEDALLPPVQKRKRPLSTPRSKQPRPDHSSIDPSAAPPNWSEIYSLVRSMRSPGGAAFPAVVDTMGCAKLSHPDSSDLDQRFQTLVALMLSSQTKDTVTSATMTRLHRELPPCTPDASPGLNMANIIAVQPAVLNELIGKVGFHNRKTEYIKGAAERIRDEHGGDVPGTLEDLVALPGVGPKMAHLCLQSAWGRTEGIGVDVHVHRIANLWGWTGRKGTRGPEETRVELQRWLPRDRWAEINELLVGLGQTVCLPVGRKCGMCEVGTNGLCRSADRAKVNEGRKMREERGTKKEEMVDDEVLKYGDIVNEENGVQNKDSVKAEVVLEDELAKTELFAGIETRGLKEEPVGFRIVKEEENDSKRRRKR